MFESVIREAADRFNLGDNATRFVRLLVDAIFDPDNGGFAGLQQRFGEAGMGEAFASWIGSTPGDNVLQPDQFNTALGAGPVDRIAKALNVPLAAVNVAGAALLPKIIGLLTRDGHVPATRPADYERWFAAPVAAAAPTATQRAEPAPVAVERSSGGGFWRWLIPLLLIIAAFLLFRSCNREPAPVVPPETTPPPAADARAPAASTAPRFGFENAGGRVAVDGQVASEAEKTRLWDALAATFGSGNLDGDIVVDTATAPAGWLDRLVDLLPELKAEGLKFGFDGERLRIDTSALADDERYAVSQRLRRAFPGYEISGLWDRAMAALSRLRPDAPATDLADALNLMEVYFETGSATITRDSAETLERAAEAIKAAASGTRFEVGGHTDNTGDAAANVTLSQQRAEAVQTRLQELGVPAGVLSAKGYGQDQPKADNDTEDGRALNRRIEFTVVD